SLTVARILRNACSRVRVVHCVWIREELDSIRCVVDRGLQNTQVSGQHRGNTVGAVEDEGSWPRRRRQTEWQSAAGVENTGDFPATDDCIHPTRRITAKHASATEGQFPDSVYVEQMTNIEI